MNTGLCRSLSVLVKDDIMTSQGIPAEILALADSLETQGKARSKVSQEKGWANIFNLAKRTIAARPDDHLSSILAELREVNIGRKDPGRYYRIKDMVRPIGASVMAKAGLTVEETFLFPDVTNSEYRIGAISPIRYLAGLIRPDTTAVMEVGSGWSSNVFQTYLAHGATRSKKIIYYGGEYTTEGQLCAKYLAKQDPLLQYRSFYFDYRNPNVEFLVRQKGHILLFTSHSIEQVDLINPALFDQLRAIPNPVTVVHFEPVGWQRIPELMARRTAQDRAYFEALGARAMDGSIASVPENAAWWSWRLEYNKNLLPIVQQLEDQGTINVVRRAYDFSGHANVLNPSSLLHYDFVR
jgi:hypothetical protein